MPAYARLRLAALRARTRNVTVEAPMLWLRGHISQLCSAEQAVACVGSLVLLTDSPSFGMPWQAARRDPQADALGLAQLVPPGKAARTHGRMDMQACAHTADARTHGHARKEACTHARTQISTHALTHARTHARSRHVWFGDSGVVGNGRFVRATRRHDDLVYAGTPTEAHAPRHTHRAARGT